MAERFQSCRASARFPKFPFSDVIEQSTALPGLAFEESVKQTARHLIQYANTAHADQDKANLLTGYLKLAHDKTNAILTRSTYKNSDNPMQKSLPRTYYVSSGHMLLCKS